MFFFLHFLALINIINDWNVFYLRFKSVAEILWPKWDDTNKFTLLYFVVQLNLRSNELKEIKNNTKSFQNNPEGIANLLQQNYCLSHVIFKTPKTHKKISFLFK